MTTASPLAAVDVRSPVWLLDPSARASLEAALAAAPAARTGASDDGGGRSALRRDGDVAIVQVAGVLTKRRGYVQAVLGGFSTEEVTAAVDQAAADPGVRGILLAVESPGGAVAGVYEAAAAVARAAARKPVMAHVADIGASGAYWIASQAGAVHANASGIVGSVGTYLVVADYSGAAAQMGVRVHVLRAGEHKGAGVPGTPVTDAQLADLQRNVNAINELFVGAVASGRRMTADRVKAVADGRAHLAASALQLGLIDKVASFADTLAELRSKSGGSSAGSGGGTRAAHTYAAAGGTSEQRTMGTTTFSGRAAADAELDRRADAVIARRPGTGRADARREAFGADEAFRQAFVAAGTDAAATQVARPTPVRAAAGAYPDAPAELERRVAAKLAGGRCRTRADAVSAVFGDDPDLRQAFIEQHNARAATAAGRR